LETVFVADPTEHAAWNSIGDINILAAVLRCWLPESPWFTAKNDKKTLFLVPINQQARNWLTKYFCTA